MKKRAKENGADKKGNRKRTKDTLEARGKKGKEGKRKKG